MTETYVLCSGGMDSAVCVGLYDDSTAIHFDYGQSTAQVERRRAMKICEKFDVPLRIIEYGLFQEFSGGVLEDQEYTEDWSGQSPGYVPLRNLHFLTTVAAIAESDGHEDVRIVYGANANDEEGYPDCRRDFVLAAEMAINRSTEECNFIIETPLIDKTKEEIREKARKLGIQPDETVSCYNREEGQSCGTCPACVERRTI